MDYSEIIYQWIDINQNALTFRTSSAFVEANATTMSIASTLGLGGFFKEDILINIRTFDIRSLVFYAYDYHNNFVQLHIEDSSRVVFTFNSGNTIYDVSATVEGMVPFLNLNFILIIRDVQTKKIFSSLLSIKMWRFGYWQVNANFSRSWTRFHYASRQWSK